MHWLPLVAMVIASALPFPHDPASRIVAATTTATPDLGSQDQSAAASSASPPRHDSHQLTDDNMADGERQNPHQLTDDNMADGERQNGKDVFLSPSRDDSGVYELNLASTLDVPPTEEQTGAEVDFNVNSDVMPDARSRRTEGFLADSDAGRLALDGLFEGGDFFLDAQPRVLFSTSASPPERPPELLLALGEDDPDWDALTEGHGDSAGDGPRREKRSHAFDGRWVQRSVCESRNYWVTDKTTAVDNQGKTVTIIQEIQTQRGPIKQYFYETRCVQRTQGARYEETGVEGASCLGIDKKQWNSRCIAKQSFVRALTKDANNRVGWRWIRIDSSCVCVLMSRTNSRGREAGPVAPGRGRG